MDLNERLDVLNRTRKEETSISIRVRYESDIDKPENRIDCIKTEVQRRILDRGAVADTSFTENDYGKTVTITKGETNNPKGRIRRARYIYKCPLL